MKRVRNDDGAVLVEFGIIAPLLFLIVFGIIEFGWGFAQYLDVRHGTRELARLAAVNYSDPANSPPSTGATQTSEIIAEACDRMGEDMGGADVDLIFTTSGEDDLGDRAEVSISRPLDTLTGFLDFALGSVVIDDDISFRLERDVTWTATTTATCP